MLRSEAERTLRGWLDGVRDVYGAYRWVPTADRYWGPGGVLIVVSAVWPGSFARGQHMYFNDDPARSTWVAFGCVEPVEPYSTRFAAGGALEPLGVVSPWPAPDVCTSLTRGPRRVGRMRLESNCSAGDSGGATGQA